MKRKVLFVDDESNILQAYRRNLRTYYEISVAESGDEALRVMVSDGPFDVIVSDMSMPQMDGAEFLSKAQDIHPDTVRIMLTGNADQQTAIRAVNEGKIYRFINKPCSPDNMSDAINSAIQQYDLVTLEKKILEDTVNGCIASLVEVMSISKPEVFGRSDYYKNLAVKCAHYMGVEKIWEVKATAMLSLIGTIFLPDNIIKSFIAGKHVTAAEAKQFQDHPALGAEIIAKIPRLESVARAIKYQKKNYNGSGFPSDSVSRNNIPVAARIMRAVISYEGLDRNGVPKEEAIKRLDQPETYDPAVVEALAKAIMDDSNNQLTETVTLDDLTEGMQIAEDIVTYGGSTLVCKGRQVTPVMITHLKNFYLLKKISNSVSVSILKGVD